MTEEIIIDCAFYKDGICASPINKTCEYCKNIDVSKCYHKQLKRLEQENKELKDYSRRMENQRENYYKEYNAYRSALEEIKSSVMDYLPKVNYKFAKSFHPEAFKLLESIVNKINEVLQ